MLAKRPLGKSGIEVAPFTLGGNVFGWTIDEATSFKILDAFVAAGFNFIDTADVYSRWKEGNKGGESETIIGKWLKLRGNRDKVVIATKVGMDMGDGKKGLAPLYITQAVEDSLRRLQTDYIDLYQSHRDDETIPQEETLETYDKLRAQGKIRAIGASNFSAKRLAEALTLSERWGYIPYSTLQPQYNLYDRADFEKELEPLCLEKGIGVINYYSLASGFLTGKYRTAEDVHKSARGAKATSYLNARGYDILKALDEVSAKHFTTPAAVSIAWLIARKSVTAPIASATSVNQLEELLKATEIKLSDADIELLNHASKY
ncbi:aldo/keto reductase [Bdellovibrio sp. NC01]|uniref:aldo/keto reductase n=1 Tax=Bdellovibrio sp. NC01 TaxID=2220073 RepID=UPI00115B9B37|nr:aldo/keto reductase [Bdellovibrio sp. NC01]QDK39294.1 aldo/keto reductase [Bdellovibrio sp. NC01]